MLSSPDAPLLGSRAAATFRARLGCSQGEHSPRRLLTQLRSLRGFRASSKTSLRKAPIFVQHADRPRAEVLRDTGERLQGWLAEATRRRPSDGSKPSVARSTRVYVAAGHSERWLRKRKCFNTTDVNRGRRSLSRPTAFRLRGRSPTCSSDARSCEPKQVIPCICHLQTNCCIKHISIQVLYCFCHLQVIFCFSETRRGLPRQNSSAATPAPGGLSQGSRLDAGAAGSALGGNPADIRPTRSET